MSMLTVASNTSAFPSMLTGVVTSSPDRGLVTTMAGSGVGELEIVGEGEPVAPAPDWDPDEHATNATATRRRATCGDRCLMCSFRRRVDPERFQPVSVTGHLALEAR
jgi:hypothetical protein